MGLIAFLGLYGLSGYAIGFDVALLVVFAAWGIYQIVAEIRNVREMKRWR